MRLCLASLLTASLICGLVSAQVCDDAKTVSSTGYNSDCPNGRPYCQGNCAVCNPFKGPVYYCDCASGQGCRSDPSSTTFGSCGAIPKYGQSCNTNSDCTTTYQGTIDVTLLCVSSKCRSCDPSDNTTHLCDVRTANAGSTMVCVSPGVWATAGSTATASLSTTNAATTTTAQGSTSTTSGDR